MQNKYAVPSIELLCLFLPNSQEIGVSKDRVRGLSKVKMEDNILFSNVSC